jgi:hypothetical protein
MCLLRVVVVSNVKNLNIKVYFIAALSKDTSANLLILTETRFNIACRPSVFQVMPPFSPAPTAKGGGNPRPRTTLAYPGQSIPTTPSPYRSLLVRSGTLSWVYINIRATHSLLRPSRRRYDTSKLLSIHRGIIGGDLNDAF